LAVTDQLPDFPMRRQCPFDPPEEYAEFRESEPVSQVRLPNGSLAWLVTRHEDARSVLADPRISADMTNPGFPPLLPINKPIKDKAFRPPFMRMDPPEHTRHRRMLIQEFTVRRVKAMRPAVQSIVDDLIDGMLGETPPLDLVERFAVPVPSLVICNLLGVPYADHEYFETRTRVLLSFDSTVEQLGTALGEIRHFLDKLITAKHDDPGDDLLSAIVTHHLDTGNIDRPDLIAMLLLLLNAGHETTSNMISLGTTLLLEHPDQLARLRADPSLLPLAIDELMRYLSIGDFVPARVASEDISIGGTPVRAGEGIIALIAAANRDPAAFEDPDTFDVGRGARNHLGFGYGVHQCIGQNLARLELETVFGTLFARIPSLQLAIPAADVRYKHEGAVFGVHELPVTWRAEP
jgi:cytochrome P450